MLMIGTLLAGRICRGALLTFVHLAQGTSGAVAAMLATCSSQRRLCSGRLRTRCQTACGVRVRLETS